ncbi:aminodeoxychorismate synthase component I [Pyruvatibacter mobilis]|uniref:aminodeoxychorismate synthase component I n=1 Tax=Pyruvatibacter mobilis TaxID=1712261 RepID=UPI003C7ED8CA
MQVPLGQDIRPVDVFAPVASEVFAQLLDWQAGCGTAYLLLDPDETLTITPGDLDPARAGSSFARLQHALDAWATRHGGYQTADTALPFTGGAAGMFAYELAYDLERLPGRGDLPAHTPVLTVGFYDAVAAFPQGADHAVIVSPWDTDKTRAKRTRLRTLIETARPATAPSTIACPAPSATVSPDDYRAAVARVIELIHAGDIFQANLTQRFDTTLPRGLTAFDIYQRLADRTPAPFAAFLTLPDRQLVSSSPERFLSVSADGHIRTEPIKGTRPRGATPDEDMRLARELSDSPKDRAENVMIVDLLRNDISRVAQDHSVKVEALCELHSFQNVHHLVSTVTGTLARDRSAIECLAACFPGGSITGAPKVRAMEIIRELEPHPRGAYCGALGFIGLSGAMDMSIPIRTLTVSGETITYHAGGGIVADSDPQAEYDETLTKASAMRRALTGDSA